MYFQYPDLNLISWVNKEIFFNSTDIFYVYGLGFLLETLSYEHHA